MNRWIELDTTLCLHCNRVSSHRLAEWLFRAVSRMGDGLLWYTLMLLFPLLLGQPGLELSMHMLATAVPALLLYRYLKRKTLRPRPCDVLPRIRRRGRPLDRFSFPSGHTLHAVAFTIVIFDHLGDAARPLLPLVLLIALSRPVLGLHYPSDVLAGALIGGLLALLSLPVAALL